MFRVRRPDASEITAQLAGWASAPFSYAEVGATGGGRSGLTPRIIRAYDVDHDAIALGTGRELFARARAALFAWRSFDVAWLELHGAAGSTREGEVVATLIRAAGLWSLNACRVVYVSNAPDCAAFAYGTLEGHAESGEERFAVTYDPETSVVSIELLAFSRPGHWLTRVGYPFARALQRRFRGDALAALARASVRD